MIRDVIFDIGNVFVRWSPAVILERALGAPAGFADNAERVRAIFSEPWLDLNRGRLSMAEAMARIAINAGLTADEATLLSYHITDHLDPIEATEALARRLKSAGYRLFALTDNVHEIVAFLKARYTFWPLFEGVANSAEIGV